MTIYQDHLLSLERRNGIAFLRLDDVAGEVNKLTRETLRSFEQALDKLQGDTALEGLVVLSAKPESFVVGADVEMLRDLRGDEAAELSRAGQALLHRLRRLPIPTVAAINGPAMGGGLELALACTYRIATDSANTLLALPEVRLGLCPGAGGTQYLPRLIGLQRALPLMLTGSNVYPHKARRIGLVETVCSRPLLERTAVDLLHRHPPRPRPPLRLRFMDTTRPGRELLFRMAAKQAATETGGHYPAPNEIIGCVREGYDNGLVAGLAAESAAFGRLLETPPARALIGLFVARSRSRRASSEPAASANVTRLGILGAGLMGAGIASVSSREGMDVLVKDRTIDVAANAVRAAHRHAEKAAAKRIISTFERDAWITRVQPVTDYEALRRCEVVIEAVPEDADLKRNVLTDVEAVLDEAAVLATNTSAIPLAELTPALRKSSRFLGMHYFSPVEKMPLLEVIRHATTSAEAVAIARQVGERQGKTVIVVNDGPGFYTTRVLAFYLNEALLAFHEGARVTDVDAAMRGFGFPMGPFELFDLVGLDTAAGITRVLAGHFAARDVPINETARLLAEAGSTGQKAASGFYTYARKGGEMVGDRDAEVRALSGAAAAADVSAGELTERLALILINEAVHVLADGVLQSPADGDLGAVFGLGFPAYTGGPLHYVDAETPQAIVQRLQHLASSFGKRFEPATLLLETAAADARFHSD